MPSLSVPALIQAEEAADQIDPIGSRYKLIDAHFEISAWIALTAFAYSVGFDVTSTVSTPAKHNVGSLHTLGRAADIRTRNQSVGDVNRLINFLLQFSIDVRDERTHPPGQKVWDGPHLHLGAPVNRAPHVLLSPLYENPGTRIPELNRTAP
jgi:hypothetical protein